MTADEHEAQAEHIAEQARLYAKETQGPGGRALAIVEALQANTHAQLAVSQRIAELQDGSMNVNAAVVSR